ncbi:hypothetical protein MNAN1_001705 [Malassezia nana]|uniref:Uncharacterized protein n=1 Tax=Malassezia nana TaxID=180528 RepID=A0AAF0ELH3_9BASI|nr:hypothetical protein MNAN1_001705 [Malassezia nana]
MLKMLPVSKSSVPPQHSPLVKINNAATAERPAGQIWVRRMSPMGTPPMGKIPLDGDESDEEGTNDEYDVVEATRAGLLRCLDESKAAP